MGEPKFKVGDVVRHGAGMPWEVVRIDDYGDAIAYYGKYGGFIEGSGMTLTLVTPAPDPVRDEARRLWEACKDRGPVAAGYDSDFVVLVFGREDLGERAPVRHLVARYGGRA